MTAHRGDTFVMGTREPAITFSTFVLSFASTALIHLGHSPNPDSGHTEINLTLARQSIDLLEMLELKTKGNLDSEESKLLASVLADLRLRYLKQA
jgi:Domain of unknown function (DUF1844)